MNILIDIGHPAHVHLFKNLSWNLIDKGFQILFSVRSGENESELLSQYNFNYINIGTKKSSLIGRIIGILSFTYKIFLFSKKNQIDLYLSHGSMYAGLAAFIRHKPHIALEDSGNMEQLRFSLPLSNVILSPDNLGIDLGRNHIQYRGYHELSYLSPKYFVPDKNIKQLLGLPKGEEYCIVRFISWNATHDIKQTGFDEDFKKQLIQYLVKRFRVYISSERPLPSELRSYRFPLSPNKLHDALNNASLVISEGATIAAEAGVLGVPSIYVNSIIRCYNEDLETYSLVHNFRNQNGVIEKINEIISKPNYNTIYKNNRKRMLEDKIDVTAFITWFVSSFPDSIQVMKTDPDFQFNFK